MIKRMPSQEQIDSCSNKTKWDLGNSTLYKLCLDNFDHETDEKIIAKVWLIGRSYAVAIERRIPDKKILSDDFYTVSVPKAFRESNIDNDLRELKNLQLTEENIPKILEGHTHLCNAVHSITGLQKRSFASKYLHFHLPNLYFIYDSRAANAINQFVSQPSEKYLKALNIGNVDIEYAKFYVKCYLLQKEIQEKFSDTLNPRQIDNLLMEVANKDLNGKFV